jgi:hypothetical protein
MKTLAIFTVSVFLFSVTPANSTGDICNIFGFFTPWQQVQEPEPRPPVRKEVQKPIRKETPPPSKWQEFKKKSEPKVVKVKEEKEAWYSKLWSPQSRGANHDGYREYTDERTKTVPVE